MVLIGGVKTTLVTLRKLHEYGFGDVAVYGYYPEDVSTVSGWTDLEQPAGEFGFRFVPFRQINDHVDELRALAPDLIFVVGLSQLVSREILEAAAGGCVGFHPTALPRGRGRAPLAWLVMRREDGAATFFRLREEVDAGPILAQQPFHVAEGDDAGTVETKMLEAEAAALDEWLPTLSERKLRGFEQAHDRATFYGRRTPSDGLVDWHDTARAIDRLVKTSTRPHPGAFTYQGDEIVTLWSATFETGSPFSGVVGRILSVAADGGFLVQCGGDVLRVETWTAESAWRPRVGVRLGYEPQYEIHRLKRHCRALESRLAELESRIRSFGDGDQE